MHALVIGASPDSLYAIETARTLGFKVTAFDGNPDAAGLRNADAAHVVDITDPEAVIKRLDGAAPAVCLPVPVGRVLATAGVVNDHFGLRGVSAAAAELCTDKYRLGTLLRAAGLRDSVCVPLVAGESPGREALRYPVIAKPRYGAGSRGLFHAGSAAELDAWLAKHAPLAEDYVLEEAVAGEEYGVEGMVENGRFRLLMLCRKILSPYPRRQAIGRLSLPCAGEYAEMRHIVTGALQQCVTAMELEDCIVNADIIYRDRRVFPIELTARPGGNKIYDVMAPLVAGVNIVEDYVRQVVPGLPGVRKPVTQSAAHLLLRTFDFECCRVLECPDPDALRREFPLVEYRCTLADETLGRFANAAYHERGYFVLAGDNPHALVAQGDALLRRFVVEPLSASARFPDD